MKPVNRLPPTHWTINFVNNGAAFVADDTGRRAVVPGRVASKYAMDEKVGWGFSAYFIAPPPELALQQGANALPQVVEPIEWDAPRNIETADRDELLRLVREVDERLDRICELAGIGEDDLG